LVEAGVREGMNVVNTAVSSVAKDVPFVAPLPVDVIETATEIVIKAGPLFGIEPENIDVSITGDTLTIRGESKEDEEPEGTYIRRERRTGAFTRAVHVPRPVKGDLAAADFKHNMLTIRLPKVETPQPKIINVQAAE
jgi:HSP20 family protein